MLAFGTAITDEEIYRRHALAGIRRVGEADSVVLERRGMSLQEAYNGMLAEAAALPDLEALVLPHQDTELRDVRFAEKLRAALRDPDVGLVGAAGARGIRSMLWPTRDSLGGWSWGDAGAEMRFDGRCGVADAVDGFLLMLSPWAVRELRFDPRFIPWFHGYDIDFSFQVRARGRKVFVVNLDVAHWPSRTALASRADWIEASVAWQRKWDPDGGRAPRGTNGSVAAGDGDDLDRLALSLTGLDRPRLRSVRFGDEEEPRLEVVDGDREERRTGRDWPDDADTMVGLVRLRDLRACVEQVLRDGVPGDLIETGVWRGGTALYMRAVLAAHADTERRVWLADSFAGLPVPDDQHPHDGAMAPMIPPSNVFLGVPREEVEALFRRHGLLDDRVRFVEGWFADTLAALSAETWSVIRLDGDLYSSTMEALDALYPRLSPGGFCVIDDYGLDCCRAAVADFRERHAITEPIVEIDWTGARWRKAG